MAKRSLAGSAKPILLYLLILLSHNALALDVKVDRNSLHSDESLTLQIIADSMKTLRQVDLTPLKANFQIGSKSTKNFTESINGNVSSQITLSVQLFPKRSGKFTIPPLRAGSETSTALQIHVSEPRASNRDLHRDGITISGSMTPSQAVIQQQIEYTLRIESVVAISAAQLSQLSSDDFDIVELDERQYQRNDQDKPVQVIEKPYLLYPKRSGELTIPSQTLSVITGGNDLFSYYRPRSQQQRQQLHSGNSTIHVSKVPHSKQNTASLVPASELLLVEIWHSNLQQARVGEPLTRQIQISARGQRSESLPDIELDSVSAANIYPETVSRDNQLANGELMAKASYHFAIIPTQAGTMTLPAVELPWWNTKTGKMDIARIPSQDIQVAAVVNPNTTQNERSLNSSQNGNIVTNADNDKAQSAGGSAHDPTNESDMTKELSGALPETLDSAQAPEAGHYLDKEAPWRLISVVFACLWIATTIISFILWRLNRASNNATRTKEAPHNNPTYAEQKAFADLQRACQQNNAQQAKLALNHWISTQKSNAKSVTHRDDSTVLHASESFESAVDSLNHALFSSSAEQRDSAWSGDELLTAVLEIRTQATKPSTNQEDALAPLYPTQKRPTSI